MSDLKRQIWEELKKGFSSADLIQVQSEDNVHFSAVVVSGIFNQESLVKRHRRVYEQVGHLLDSQVLHALALKTYTPEEWSKANG